MAPIPPTNNEREDLSVHVDMCSLRFEALDNRLTKVEIELQKISNDIKSGNSALIKVIVGTTGTIIASILSVVIVMILRGK